MLESLFPLLNWEIIKTITYSLFELDTRTNYTLAIQINPLVFYIYNLYISLSYANQINSLVLYLMSGKHFDFLQNYVSRNFNFLISIFQEKVSCYYKTNMNYFLILIKLAQKL